MIRLKLERIREHCPAGIRFDALRAIKLSRFRQNELSW